MIMAESNYAIIKSYAQSPEIVQRFAEITGSERKANSYINSVIIAVSADDNLKECTPQSIMKSAADAANLGLDVDPRIGEAYLVPYGKNATLITGWRGLRNMAYNTGKVLYLNTNAVYEGQEWVEDQLTGKAHIEGSRKPGGEPIGYFAYLETKDHRVHTVYMTIEEIQEHKKKYAKGWNRQGSAWNTDFAKMAKKTVLRQLLMLYAELDTRAREYLMDADMDEGNWDDEFPDPAEVTKIEKPKHTNEEIIDTLYAGMKNDDEPTVIDAEYSEEVPDPEPEPAPKQKAKAKAQPKKKEQTKTNYPGSQSEYYSWIAQGKTLPHIGISDAKKALEQCKGSINDAWDLIQSWSIERTELRKRETKDQPELI
jgi:recombination protein RecT